MAEAATRSVRGEVAPLSLLKVVYSVFALASSHKQRRRAVRSHVAAPLVDGLCPDPTVTVCRTFPYVKTAGGLRACRRAMTAAVMGRVR